MKPRIYIAAPFFNSEQVRIVAMIEGLIKSFDFPFYSPRLDSGSRLLSPEDRKIREKWQPVLHSNIDELDKADLILAVLEYAMPQGYSLFAGRSHIDVVGEMKKLELPDNGVVFECGYAYARGKSIIGFHSTKPLDEMNLMLSHTMSGHITGFEDLARFLQPGINEYGEDASTMNWNYVQQYRGEVI